jgi:DNA-binding CsgD family transcriptional regulator
VRTEPFVGRTNELQQLSAALDRVRAGTRATLAVSGSAGIGKTRLLRELAQYAASRGMQVIWGRAYETGADAAPPYWPWVQALRELVSLLPDRDLRNLISGDRSELVRLLPGLQSRLGLDLPLGTDRASQFRLRDEVSQFLDRAARPVPLIVILDDLQWADVASLELIEHLISEPLEAPVLVATSFRSDDVGRRHPLNRVLPALARLPGFQHVELTGLTRREVARYMRGLLAVSPDEELLTRVHGITEGNPLFVREIINWMLRDGVPGPGQEVTIPSTIRAMIGQRLDRLSSECDHFLHVAALCGTEFSSDLVAQVADAGLFERISAVLDEARRAHLIESTGRPAEWRFSHEIIAETLRREIETLQKRTLHAEIAAAIEVREPDSGESRAAELAHHYFQASTGSAQLLAKALHFGQLAGEQAERMTAWGEALRHYRNCLSLLGVPDAADTEPLADLLVALARCSRNADDEKSSWEYVHRALEVARANDDWLGLARVVLESSNLSGDPERHVERLTEALSSPLELPPPLRAQLLSWRARYRGFTQEGDEDAVAAGELAVRHNLAIVDARLTHREALKASRGCEFEQASKLLLSASRHFEAVGHHSEAAAARNRATAMLVFAGDLDGARVAAEDEGWFARSVHIRRQQQTSAVSLAFTALIRCDLELARRLIADLQPDSAFAYGLRICLAEFEAAYETPEDLLSDLLPPLEAAGVTGSYLTSYGLRARVRHLAGDAEGARGELGAWLRLAVEAVEGPYGAQGEDAAVGDALVDLGDEQTIGAAYHHVFADTRHFATASNLDRVRGELALKLGYLAEASSHFERGLEICRRQRCPVEAARNLLGLADIAHQHGECDAARDRLEAALAILSRYPHALASRRALHLREALDEAEARQPGADLAVPGLSQREVQVLKLVARGMTNAEIARELRISPNTVANHLKRIRSKTGTANRTEAAVLLGSAAETASSARP